MFIFMPMWLILTKLYQFIVPQRLWKEEHQMVIVGFSVIITVVVILYLIFWLYPLYINTFK